MRQIGAERNDPLKRIQEEINEVAKRERELRAHMQRLKSETGTEAEPTTTTTDNSENLKQSPIIDDCSNISTISSDDSGFSTSSSPVNGTSANHKSKDLKISTSRKYIKAKTVPTPTYIRTATAFSFAPRKSSNPFQETNMLTRTMSTPQIYQSTPNRKFNITPNQKGLMQRFIATRGRLTSQRLNSVETAPIIDMHKAALFLLPAAPTTPPVIERDEDGKPIRRGYIPVEEKIQKELREMKSREVELKRQRKQSNLRQSQSDLLDLENHQDSGEFELNHTDDDDDDGNYSDPGKMRSAKSIGELCDALTTSSLSPRNTPSPQLDRRSHGKLRPALSLAQLCDLDPTEAPSSHRLIAQWENIIQKRQEVA